MYGRTLEFASSAATTISAVAVSLFANGRRIPAVVRSARRTACPTLPFLAPTIRPEGRVTGRDRFPGVPVQQTGSLYRPEIRRHVDSSASSGPRRRDTCGGKARGGRRSPALSGPNLGAGPGSRPNRAKPGCRRVHISPFRSVSSEAVWRESGHRDQPRRWLSYCSVLSAWRQSHRDASLSSVAHWRDFASDLPPQRPTGFSGSPLRPDPAASILASRRSSIAPVRLSARTESITCPRRDK